MEKPEAVPTPWVGRPGPNPLLQKTIAAQACEASFHRRARIRLYCEANGRIEWKRNEAQAQGRPNREAQVG